MVDPPVTGRAFRKAMIMPKIEVHRRHQVAHQALYEHGAAHPARDDRLTRSATNPRQKVRKILDTTRSREDASYLLSVGFLVPEIVQQSDNATGHILCLVTDRPRRSLGCTGLAFPRRAVSYCLILPHAVE